MNALLEIEIRHARALRTGERSAEMRNAPFRARAKNAQGPSE